MTQSQMQQQTLTIGSPAYLTIDELKIPVVVRDTRRVWNRDDLLVEPVGGTGTKWVEKSRVSQRLIDIKA